MMIYPTISEYMGAIKDASDSFEALVHLTPVTDTHGDPVMSSGNFAVVFRMKNSKNEAEQYAVKCFLKEQPGREESYRKIAETLDNISSPYLTTVKYYERELFVDSKISQENEFPVVLMKWENGLPLDKYVRKHQDNPYKLGELSDNFSELAMWLLQQPFAHGDLKPDNILIRENGIPVLVDYDGMYVPAMKGESSRETGSPDYRHPARTAEYFNEHLDDFPLTVLALTLRLLYLDNSLIKKEMTHDSMLFCERDYRDLTQGNINRLVLPHLSDPTLCKLYVLFLTAHATQNLNQTFYHLFQVQTPEFLPLPEGITSEITDEDLKDAVIDQDGIQYSRNGIKLLKAVNKNLTSCTIRKGTRIICNSAFSYCKNLETIDIPNSVTSIGESTFWWCTELKQINIPESVTNIRERVFCECRKVKHIHLPDGVTSIESRAFEGCTGLKQINIPESVKSIGEQAFSRCTELTTIQIPKTVTSIEPDTFRGCTGLITIGIPEGVARIGQGAFYGCIELTAVHIPEGVKSIENFMFSGCTKLKQINIPKGVTSIKTLAFYGCAELTTIRIPEKITQIGGGAFNRVKKITSNNQRFIVLQEQFLIDTNRNVLISYFGKTSNPVIPEGIIGIGRFAFNGCTELITIYLPKTIKSIEEGAFAGCTELRLIRIPERVTHIGWNAFARCRRLTII